MPLAAAGEGLSEWGDKIRSMNAGDIMLRSTKIQYKLTDEASMLAP